MGARTGDKTVRAVESQARDAGRIGFGVIGPSLTRRRSSSVRFVAASRPNRVLC